MGRDVCVRTKEIPASIQGWSDRIPRGLLKVSWVSPVNGSVANILEKAEVGKVRHGTDRVALRKQLDLT